MPRTADMGEHPVAASREKVGEVYRSESRRVFATLVRLLGDFDLAEDALHNAFAAALEQWPGAGMPENPRAWLVSVGRFKEFCAWSTSYSTRDIPRPRAIRSRGPTSRARPYGSDACWSRCCPSPK